MSALTPTAVLDALSIAPNLLAALVFGMLIGIERQWKQRTTGLTTHALVSLGSAAFAALAILVGDSLDVRMGGQVVTGIGFLGAGLIMRDGFSVKGLSGAATVWATGAIGVLAGYGFFIEAAEATLFVILINVAMPRLARLIERYAPESEMIERFYVVELKCMAHDEAVVRNMLLHSINTHKLRLSGLESHDIKETTKVEVEAVIYSSSDKDELIERLVGELSASPLIFAAKWTTTTPPE